MQRSILRFETYKLIHAYLSNDVLNHKGAIHHLFVKLVTLQDRDQSRTWLIVRSITSEVDRSKFQKNDVDEQQRTEQKTHQNPKYSSVYIIRIVHWQQYPYTTMTEQWQP